MRKRILVIHYTPPGVVGGVESILQQHRDLLEARGFQVEVVAGRSDEGAGTVRVIPEIDAARPESAAIEEELAAGVVSQRFHAARAEIMTELEPLAREAETIIVHNALTLHFSVPLAAAIWEIAATRPEGSIVAWCHDLAWTNPLYIPALHDGYPWDLLRLPAPGVRYVTVSEERRKELLGLWGRGEVTVVPNGIDVESFLRLSGEAKDVARRYRLFDRELVLLLPVRITRRKNFEAAIRAVRSLKDQGLDVLLLVSGPTAPHHPGRSRNYLAELKQYRDELRIHNEVVFLADELQRNLAIETIAQLYTLADVLIFPSRQEGFGLPILEAGLARVPAVITDIPIFREVGDDAVWHFDVDAAADTIAAAVLEAVAGRPSHLYRRVLREYRWDVIVDTRILPLLDREIAAGGNDVT